MNLRRSLKRGFTRRVDSALPQKEIVDSSATPASVETEARGRLILKVNNFVDGYDLKLLEHQIVEKKCHGVLFVDRVSAENLDRWTNQKTLLCQQLLPLVKRHRWQIQHFQTTLQINLDGQDVDTICDDILGQVHKDPGIVGLEFIGNVPWEEEHLRTIVFALVGLLSLRDRIWQQIRFCLRSAPRMTIHMGLDGGVELHLDLPTETAIQTQCRRILEESSATFQFPIEFDCSRMSLRL